MKPTKDSKLKKANLATKTAKAKADRIVVRTSNKTLEAEQLLDSMSKLLDRVLRTEDINQDFLSDDIENIQGKYEEFLLQKQLKGTRKRSRSDLNDIAGKYGKNLGIRSVCQLCSANKTLWEPKASLVTEEMKQKEINKICGLCLFTHVIKAN